MDSTILILLAALLLHSCDGGPVRMRRRAKPKGAQLHNLEQLQHECCGHGYLHCCEETRFLQKPNSTINIDFQECLQDVRDMRQLPIVINPLPNTISPDESTPIECPLSRQEKIDARDDYCDLFNYIDIIVTTNIYYLQTFNRCVDYFDHGDYQTPTEMLQAVKNWRFSMIDRHHCCTRLKRESMPWENMIANERHRNQACTARETHDNTNQWDTRLTQFARVIRMVEMLESLGRRRQCLRGCVSYEEVSCANIIL